MLKLTAHDEYTIIAALRVASEAYANDAANVRDNNARLFDQFRRQSDACLKLADQIEQHGIAD